MSCLELSLEARGISASHVCLGTYPPFCCTHEGASFAGPTIGRATVLAAVEMSSYDEIKNRLIAAGLIKDKTAMGVFTCAVASGFFCAVFSSPFDVVKSRVMGQPVGPDGVGKLYTGMIDCFSKSVRNEGVFSLWKGFFPNW